MRFVVVVEPPQRGVHALARRLGGVGVQPPELEALALHEEMLAAGVEPSLVSYNAVLEVKFK